MQDRPLFGLARNTVFVAAAAPCPWLRPIEGQVGSRAAHKEEQVSTGERIVSPSSWYGSPNNRFIALAANPDENHDIYIIKPGGSDLQRATGHEASDYVPQWSPDSNDITFVSTRDGKPEIYIVNEAGEELRVTDDPAGEIFPA